MLARWEIPAWRFTGIWWRDFSLENTLVMMTALHVSWWKGTAQDATCWSETKNSTVKYSSSFRISHFVIMRQNCPWPWSMELPSRWLIFMPGNMFKYKKESYCGGGLQFWVAPMFSSSSDESKIYDWGSDRGWASPRAHPASEPHNDSSINRDSSPVDEEKISRKNHFEITRIVRNGVVQQNPGMAASCNAITSIKPFQAPKFVEEKNPNRRRRDKGWCFATKNTNWSSGEKLITSKNWANSRDLPRLPRIRRLVSNILLPP
jgi:hypothetical protein